MACVTPMYMLIVLQVKMVSAIDVKSGKVVDFEIKSKVCFKYHAKSDLDPNSDEHIRWMETHGPKCSANFNKSSNAMEAQGAVDIWGRSVDKHRLRYVDFVGDGDCSSHRDVVKLRPYSEENGRKAEKKEKGYERKETVRWEDNFRA